MEKSVLEKISRAIFHGLHSVQANDDYIFERLSTLLSTEHLKVEKEFFKNKQCLDAGCGSNANATYNMLQMGAEKVIGFDLDETIFEHAPTRLKEFEGRFELQVDNVLEMSFEDETFDFTHCAGVLHHTYDLFKGLDELTRVTKKGGMLFIETYGKGGILRDFTSLLRKKYKEEKWFKALVDNLDHEELQNGFKWIVSEMTKHGDSFGEKISDDVINTLVDKDMVLTIKDRITSPVYYEHDYQELESCLKEHGFIQIERLTRYPNIKNIRRFLCPIYNEYESAAAKILYGDSTIQIKAVKS